MKLLWSLVFVTTLCWAVPLGAAPQFRQGRERTQNWDRVCVYQDIRFQGAEQCYSVGDEISNLGRRNNAISSIRIFGGALVTVYEDTNFRGRSMQFTADVPDLGLRNVGGSRSWSDHIQSLRVSQLNSGANRYYGRGSSNRYPDQQGQLGQQVGDGVCVYERPDFQGRSQCWNAGENLSDLARAGNWSDRIASIRVFGRAMAALYRDIGFRGESITVDRDIRDLGRSWDRQASSLQIEIDRGNRGRIGGDRRWR